MIREKFLQSVEIKLSLISFQKIQRNFVRQKLTENRMHFIRDLLLECIVCHLPLFHRTIKIYQYTLSLFKLKTLH
jgi:hypothetical protein